MKKILIICLLAFLSINFIFSQNLESIVDTSKTWVEYRVYSEDPPNSGDSYAYKIKDSSLISENYWMKLWESSDSNYSEWENIGYLKEKDSVVLFMDLSSSIDTLYDFTKKSGEKIVINDCEFTVDSVNTTNFIGKDRFTINTLDDQYYEGIGSSMGLLYPMNSCLIGVFRTLICYYEDGELKYHNEDFNSCNYNTTAVFNTNIQNIKVYPNPIIDRLQIDNVEINTQLNIYNSVGQVLYSKTLIAKNSSIILPDFKGYCIIQLTSKNGEIIYSKSIVK